MSVKPVIDCIGGAEMSGESGMGWRDVLLGTLETTEHARYRPSYAAELLAADIERQILDMPTPARIALARELLPPGFVVAVDVGEITGRLSDADKGWNACRAAMLEDGE